MSFQRISYCRNNNNNKQNRSANKQTSITGGNILFPRLVQNKYSYNTVRHFNILKTEMLVVDSCNVHVHIFSSYYINSIFHWKTKQRFRDAGKKAAFCFKSSLFCNGNTSFFPLLLHIDRHQTTISTQSLITCITQKANLI